MVSQYKQRAAIRPAKDNIDGTFRHINASDLFSRGVVDEDLAVRHVHIAVAIDSDALTAAIGKGTQIAERPALAN